jgi:glycosyltransferase involved in cell wall biosynthesis
MKASVIIPAYNQAERLYLTLVSLSHQTCDPSLFEVIVVDDGSVDETSPIVQSYSAPYHLKYIHQPNRGRAISRNQGVRESSGDTLIFNDCDRAVCSHFVEAHLARHGLLSDSVVIGAVFEFFFSDLSSRRKELAEDIEHGFSKFARFAREYPYAKVVSKIYEPDGTTAWPIPWISFFSGNVSVSRKAFEEIGGFDEAFTGWGCEHFELGYRLYQAGLQYIFEPSARNYHFAHRREDNFYQANLRASFEYFKRKHPRQEVEQLENFIKGNLSLQEYNALVAGESSGMDKQNAVYLPQSVTVNF